MLCEQFRADSNPYRGRSRVAAQGIAGLVNDEPDMKMVAEAATGAEAIKQFKQYRPDITLMDLQMPEMSGIEAITEIRVEFPAGSNHCPTTYTVMSRLPGL